MLPFPHLFDEPQALALVFKVACTPPPPNRSYPPPSPSPPSPPPQATPFPTCMMRPSQWPWPTRRPAPLSSMCLTALWSWLTTASLTTADRGTACLSQVGQRGGEGVSGLRRNPGRVVGWVGGLGWVEAKQAALIEFVCSLFAPSMHINHAFRLAQAIPHATKSPLPPPFPPETLPPCSPSSPHPRRQ